MRVQVSSITYADDITAEVTLDPADGCYSTRLRVGGAADPTFLSWYESLDVGGLASAESRDPASVAALLRQLADDIDRQHAALRQDEQVTA